MKLYAVVLVLFFSSISIFSQEDIAIKGTLPETVSETSGLIFYNNKLITHNDSGDLPQLYEIDTTSLEVTRTINIENAENIDWEDITQDDMHIYIGDIGNNVGVRTNLRIYKIAKEDYNSSNTISAEIINFRYQDQTSFENNGNSDWDAEALFVLDNELIILTKQWQSLGTVAYAVPKMAGDYELVATGSFDIDGLVTGATYNTDSDVLFIAGYTEVLTPFTVRISAVTKANIFNESLIKTNLDVGLAQIESIAFIEAGRYMLSSEYFSRMSPNITLESQLFVFSDEMQQIEPEPEPEPEPQPEPVNEGLLLFQRQGFDLLEYELNSEEEIIGRAVYDITGRQVFYTLGSNIERHSLDIATLQNSVYYLTFYFPSKVVSVPFFKY